MAKQTIVLVILDGWGIGRGDASNPIHVVGPENINYIKHNYLAGSLQASGIAVGLPWNEEGNSEVGHLTLGAGKIIYQHYPRISLAIEDGSFFKNGVLTDAFKRARENNADVHFVGLLTDSGVHAHIDHLQALIKLAGQENFENFNLHLFTDGKDAPPQGALKLISKIPQEKIASLSGRFYAMDRDAHLDRTARTYEALMGKEQMANGKVDEFLRSNYERGVTDDFIEPAIFRPGGAIKEGDSVIFFNFREDSIRQLVKMFLGKNFYLATFTKYAGEFDLPVAFPSPEVTNPLGKALSDAGKVQLRIAETEKYAHVTYFFNGFREEPFKNEYRVLIPSRPAARPEEYPAMMAPEVTTRVASALDEGVYDFILVNYANPDMIAHTGNFEAAKQAVEVVDGSIGDLMKVALAHDHVLVITADHGNVERMIDPRTGLVETKHDPSQVPVYIVGRGYEKQKDDAVVKKLETANTGVLSDIAPTILTLMDLPIPPEMTGVNLLDLLE